MDTEQQHQYDPADPLRMEFQTPEERDLARKIRTALQSTPEIDNLSDFYCAQLAIATTANAADQGVVDESDEHEETGIIRGAVHTAQHLQDLKEQYDIRDTQEDAHKSIRDFLNLMGPRAFLSFGFYRNGGSYCVIYDISQVKQERLKSRSDVADIVIRGMFYMCHALACDLEAVRRGGVLICECEGFDWKEHLDFAMVRKIYTEVSNAYPVTFQRFKYFHAGVFINMLNSLKRRILPKRMVDKIDRACQFDGNLSDMYLVPTPEAACEKVCRNFCKALTTRYNNQRSFRLDRQDEGIEPAVNASVPSSLPGFNN